MSRTRPDSELLRRGLTHFGYEVQMLEQTHAVITLGILGEGAMRNACLESWVLHLRNLIDFFYADAPQADDLAALDYVADWQAIRPVKPAAFEIAKRRANKEIAHLSAQRMAVAPEDKPLDVATLTQEIRAVAEVFLSALRTQSAMGGVQ
ncbi:MAG: hypothetical protein ABW199_07895 [Caulobacterales bacterium]